MTLASRLVELRRERGLTQQQLGEKLNITAQAISKWENGLAEPDLSMLKTLANIYNISIAELLGEEVLTDGSAQSKEQLIGMCTVCGIVVTESNVGTRNPRVLCKTCREKLKEEEASKRREEEEIALKAAQKKESDRAKAIQKAKDKRKKGLVTGAFAAIVVFVIMIVVTITQWNNFTVSDRIISCIGCVILPYLSFAFAACMFYEGPALYVVMWGFVHSVKWPGIIFSLDLGGLVFLIAVKALFAVLSFLIGIFTAMLGIALGAVISAVQFPVTYGKKVENTIKE